MKHYVPWINWIGISKENKEHAYNEPVKILDSLGVEKKIPLYNFLGTNVELSNTPYFPHVSFDKYKYIKSEVPFYYKWKLNECIKRDKKREEEMFDKFVKNSPSRDPFCNDVFFQKFARELFFCNIFLGKTRKNKEK